MKTCPKCGRSCSDKTLTCWSCGAMLDTPSDRLNPWEKFWRDRYKKKEMISQPRGSTKEGANTEKDDYEDPEWMTFRIALKVCLFKKYARFRGRASMREFWGFVLFLVFWQIFLCCVWACVTLATGVDYDKIVFIIGNLPFVVPLLSSL